MNSILKNIIAFILGWLVGSAVNMGLVTMGYQIFPVEGLDTNDMNSILELMPTFEAKQFLFPFLAHALGTLVGAAVAYTLAATHKMRIALGIGIFFLIGGIMVNFMLPGPTWFWVLDILVAYIPMAWIGTKIAKKITTK